VVRRCTVEEGSPALYRGVSVEGRRIEGGGAHPSALAQRMAR